MSNRTSAIWLNGEFMDEGDPRAQFGLRNYSLHYGLGLFEGMRAYWNGREEELFSFRHPEHYERFLGGMRALRFPERYSVEELCRVTRELLQRNQYRETVYIRPIAFVDTEQIGVSPDHLSYSVAILSLPMDAYTNAGKGLHATISKWQRPRDTMIPPGIKISGAYVNPALALQDAHLSGYDDAILLNDQGCVTEAATANIFLARQSGTLHDASPAAFRKGQNPGILVTPPSSDGILRGITRDSVIQIARGLGMRVEEMSLRPSELWYASEVFLTGTAYEIAPITRVDHRSIGNGSVGPYTTALRRAYTKIVHRESVDDFPRHLQHVLRELSELWIAPTYTTKKSR